ncbi:cardiomyopathy-associated protein 5 isoform X2 [Calypte anna]|uniref:cardiomyopathy-associated protein 5 isoform X2 n=1 Tax=Calypte anna TaxID=9244 RepID=UPI0011C3EFC6|nr:cardiomyopathy-associated protein 5 isoform X2 [Calypte anna]
MEGYHRAECDRASETSSFIGDEEEEEEEEEEGEEEEEEEAVDPEEAEELTNSLKDLIQSEDVKPKLQCIMNNPSFSMVTVQSEDSGITWETSSSRSSTPWASETSTTSDLYSMESSPVGSPPGKVIFIMDEGKIVCKRQRKSSNRAATATNLKGGQGTKKRDSSGMQRQEPRTVLGDVQGSMLNVEQVEAQNTDEEMLDDKEDLENIAEEPVKRAPIRSIFRESRLRKVGPILGGPVQARIQLFNSIFGVTEPETPEKTRTRRSSSVSGDSERLLETSVKERLQKFSSFSEVTHPKSFQKTKSRNLVTPSERRREQRQQSTAHAKQSYSSPATPLGKHLTGKDDVSSENITPTKMKDKPSRLSSLGEETVLQHKERKDKQPLLEIPGQSMKPCPPEEAKKKESYSTLHRTSVTEQSPSVSLESDANSEKQVLPPSAETANKKPDQSLLTASDLLEEPTEQDIQPSSAPQSVSADFANELGRQSTQPILPAASVSEHTEKERQKSAAESHLPSAPSAKSKDSTLSEIRQENMTPQSSESAPSESEHMLLPYSVDEAEKQDIEYQSSATSQSETEHLDQLYSAKKAVSQDKPPPEMQNIHLKKQAESEEQRTELNLPIPEKIDSKYLGISYPDHTKAKESHKTSAVNKGVDSDHTDFSTAKTKQAESAQMEMEHPDISCSSKETGESEGTQMEAEYPNFSVSKEVAEESEGAQLEMEHPDSSFSREEVEEAESPQLETEHPDFSYSREKTEESESAKPETEYPELLFSREETEELESAKLETEHPDFSYSREETVESESAQLEIEHPDSSFSREETEELENAKLETEHPDFSYSREETVESESAQLEMEHQEVLCSREEIEKQESVPIEPEWPESYSHEEPKQEETQQLAEVPSDFPCLVEETEKENNTEVTLVHLDRSDSTRRAETQQTEYLETAESDLPCHTNKTKQQELAEVEHNSFMSQFGDKGEKSQPVQQDSQPARKLTSYAKEAQEETTQLQSEHPHKTSQLTTEQPEIQHSTGKTKQQETLQPKLKQTDLTYSPGETAQGGVQKDSEGPEQSCFTSEPEQHENAQLASKNNFSFTVGQVMQEGVESGSLGSMLSTDRAKTWEMSQSEQLLPSCSTAGSQEQETPPLDVAQPDVSYTFGRMEQQDIVWKELEQQETAQQKAMQVEMKYSDLSETCRKDEPQVTDQIDLAQQETTEPGLVHSSLPYSLSEQMPEEMQTEPEYPEYAFSVTTEMKEEVMEYESEQPFLSSFMDKTEQEEIGHLEKGKLTHCPGKTEQLKHAQQDLEQPDLSFSINRPDDEMFPTEAGHVDVSYPLDNTEMQQRVQRESEQTCLTYTSGKAEQKGIQPEVEIPPVDHSVGMVEPEKGHPDLPYPIFKAEGPQTTQLKPQHPSLACSLDKVQETSQMGLEQLDALYVHDKPEQLQPIQQELGHTAFASPTDRVGQQGMVHTTLGCSAEEHSVSKSEYPQAVTEKPGSPDALPHSGKVEQREMAKTDQELSDLSYSSNKMWVPEATHWGAEEPDSSSWPRKTEQAQTAQEEQPRLLHALEKSAGGEEAQPESVHSQLLYSVGEAGTEAGHAKSSHSDLSAGRLEHYEPIQPEAELMNLSYTVCETQQPQMAEVDLEYSDLLHSTGTVQQQEKIQPEQEQPGDFSSSLSKKEQWEGSGLQAGHPELQCPMGKTEGLQKSQTRSEYADLSFSAGTAEPPKTTQPELKEHDLLHSFVKTKPSRATPLESEHPDISDALGKVPHPDLSSSVSEHRKGAELEVKQERRSHKLQPEETVQLELEQPVLSRSSGTAQQPSSASQEGQFTSLYSSGKKEQQEISKQELEHSDLPYSTDKTDQEETTQLGLGQPDDKSEQLQADQKVLQQQELLESFSKQEEKEVDQPSFLQSRGKEKQKIVSPLDLVQPGLSDLLGKAEKQGTAHTECVPSDFSYSTGKAEQLQAEQLKSKHPDLSYSLGKGETCGMKSSDLLYSYGKEEQAQPAQLEHPETSYFMGEMEQRDEAQPELKATSLQYSAVETEQPETPSISHTFGRTEEQGIAQPDLEESDLLSPTEKAGKHETALLTVGHSEKRGIGATSLLTAQLESKQEDSSFSSKEEERQPYSSLTEQTVSVPLGVSYSVSETKPEESLKPSPVTGGLSPKQLDLSYTHCKREKTQISQLASGFFSARKEAENTKVHTHFPVTAQSEAEHVILSEKEREQTPRYFHAIQLESEQLNLSYSADKTETLESQDYLTVTSKLESQPSVSFYSADETCQQGVPSYSKPVSEYLVPTQSLDEQEKPSMQSHIPQSAQSECKHAIPAHGEKELQKIQLYSPKPAQLESTSLTHTEDKGEQESQDWFFDTKYFSSDQIRSTPRFGPEKNEQEIQPDVQTVPRSVTTESKVTAVEDQQEVSSDSFYPLPEKPVSLVFTDDKEKQNIPSSLSKVVDILGQQSSIVSGIYTGEEDKREMKPYFTDQKHTPLEHLGAVSSEVVYETVKHKTQHYSGEQGSLSSEETKSVSSGSDGKQNPDIPPLGLATWLMEEVRARSVCPLRATEAETQGNQLSQIEASDFGSKQIPAESCTEPRVHGATMNRGYMFRFSDSGSSEISHRGVSSETSHRVQRCDLPGPDQVTEHETRIESLSEMEAMQYSEAGKVSEMPECYLRGEEEEMEHTSIVGDSQHAPEPTEQKDLFNIISEGYEILNIHAPKYISSVDQEESKHMPDKLEYLETKHSFKRKSADDGQRALNSGKTTEISEHSLLGEPTSHEFKELAKNHDVEESGETQQENPMLPEDNNNAVLDDSNSMADMDYFEKYTLIDDKSPVKLPNTFQRPSTLFPVIEDPNELVEDTTTSRESAGVDTLEEEFSLLENLDEVFYGTEKGESKIQTYTEAPKPLPLQKSTDSSSKKVTNIEDERKSPGTPLFDTEEGVLERSLLFPTTVAAVNPELLEEPPALSFLYKDLYAEAVGEKAKDETPSDEESGNSNASFPSRNSDTDDGTGIYFEKYILKDEIPSKATGPQIDQIHKVESFSGEISVQRSEDKYNQECGDVQLEVLPERAVVEKVQADSDIQAKICKPVHAIPFGSKVILSGARSDATEQTEQENLPTETTEELQEQSNLQAYSQHVDYQGATYQEASNKTEEQHEITAVPERGKYVPYIQAPVEDSEDDQYTQENLSCVPSIQQVEKSDLEREEQHPDVYEDLAESMDYDVITQEELLQDEISSQFTHEELLFEDRDSFEHVGDSYEFVNEPEQRTPVEIEDSGFVVMYPEKSASNIPQVESSQKEQKKAQADTYCYNCKCPISAIDKLFGDHKGHEVTTLDEAATKMKDHLGELLITLEEKSMKIEGFVSDIESLFNSVEENCKKNAELLEKQNEEMLKKVVAQYDEKSESFEEVKKMKMEYLYEQMINFQQTVDSAKETLETTVKEVEELDGFVFLNSTKELHKRLLSAMDTTLSLEKVPSAFSLFEHYADSPGQSNQHSVKHVAVPQTPTVIAQEPNSATSTSIAVYWAVNDGDAIDCFQVFCMEELQASKDAGGLVEEYRVTVKESHCILEDLEPDRCYSVWVMAVNGTGCSLPSEKMIFKTAPAVPTIKAEDCTVCWDTATIRWSASSGSAESFTLEYCRQHSPEGEGLRSFAVIKKPELKVSLEPNVNYFFYLRAVNPFGTSEQSEAALISTKGTRFHLLSDTAHPALQISSNTTVICLPEKAKFTGFPSVLGELLPARGRHYWETVVSACRSYRIGICYEITSQSSVLGLTDTSWCMQCCPTQTSFLYRFLHTGVMSDVHVTEHLSRIGILLDYSSGRLLFFNAERGLLLFTIRHKFTDAAHPAFSLEKPGVLTLRTGMELPEFVKNS